MKEEAPELVLEELGPPARRASKNWTHTAKLPLSMLSEQSLPTMFSPAFPHRPILSPHDAYIVSEPMKGAEDAKMSRPQLQREDTSPLGEGRTTKGFPFARRGHLS